MLRFCENRTATSLDFGLRRNDVRGISVYARLPGLQSNLSVSFSIALRSCRDSLA
ncbi:hypothetical protein SAMN04487785_108141 [Dyella jiangningensis]|nr:hypothetical protein BDW41_11057 [Dyella sp. AtDHG13]SDK53471.1 hypothetical protein SAMN04487785_108141 [Dyella jiangningensis]